MINCEYYFCCRCNKIIANQNGYLVNKMNVRNSTSPIDVHSVIPMEILESDTTYFDSCNYEVGISKLFVLYISTYLKLFQTLSTTTFHSYVGSLCYLLQFANPSLLSNRMMQNVASINSRKVEVKFYIHHPVLHAVYNRYVLYILYVELRLYESILEIVYNNAYSVYPILTQ